MNKKTYILLLATALAWVFTSCDKFLDREPISQITKDNYFNSEKNANSAVIGMYRTMLSSFGYGQSMIIVPEFSAQHVAHASAFPEYEQFAAHGVQNTNPWTNNIWQSAYATINAANNIIARVPEMDDALISDEAKNGFVGEAKFIRALEYFFLVRAFGNVPLQLMPTDEEDDLATPLSNPEEIYVQIVEDLTDAMSLLEDGNQGDAAFQKGRASHLAVKALLAKVYLYQAAYTNDYGQAAELAKEVIDDPRLALVQDYGSIWSAENTAESIFELQFDEQATNPLAAVGNDNASMLFYVKGSAPYELFEETDKRRDVTLKFGSRDRYYMGKFPNNAPATQNLLVIRLAEIYLIHAEAQARVDNAVSASSYASLEKVQERAEVVKPIAIYTDLDMYIRAIQEEKQRELLFEGETWFDFCRTGLALDKFESLDDENYFIYPIPESQRALNPGWSQNEGYN
ncbi:RagB/SusD family nutrient uptake outer membrane protein [Sphingobacterium olei]|uniref:RagB/SusD family nutrient uptake outer membrane protein n=1 Tax=Sphingobacterium olei TaxID=2571155 RepID=A0A4U0NYN1_9SPHI|nr:RagB/SusD family nutrient uptake outer membrane protein [Sphingobacterium olei]TJZ59977.1 RagB/SusD family nutrient uptake outer membrane protein [Sphingobacterium olei]